MDWGDLVTKFGPLGLGWVVAAYLGKFILDRYDRDIESRTKLASVLEQVLAWMKENGK